MLIARDNPNCWSIIPYTINSSNQMWCKCFQSRLYELQNRERISLAAASKLLSNMAMLMPLFNTLIVVMIFKTWVSPWVWWSLGMTRGDPGSVMLTGVNIVQLDYLFHIKGLSVWSLIATQRLKEIFGKRPDMQIWIFGDFYLPLYKTIQYHARPCNTPLLDCVC